MRSRLTLLSALLGAGLSASGSARAEELPAQENTNVLGVLNPRNGSFRPLPLPAAQGAPAASSTIVSGQLNVTVVAFNRSALPTTTALWCNVTAIFRDGTGLNPVTERLYMGKAVVTPASVFCFVKIPYQVEVTDPSNAFVTVSPTIADGRANPFAADRPSLYFGGAVTVGNPGVSLQLPPDGATTPTSIFTVI